MDEPGTARPSAARALARGLWADAAFGIVLAAVSLMVVLHGTPDGSGRPLTVVDGFAAAAVFVLTLLRRQWPLAVLAVSAALAIAATVAEGHPEAFVVTTVVAVYTVATRTSRLPAWLIGGGTALALYAVGVATGQGWLNSSIGVVAWIGMATAVGDATRSRRAYVAAVEERARRAEQTREEEARRQVAEERVRIARDLHDVVAHHIAVINVHAGLAEHTLRTRPDQAESSLEHVRRAAQTVLDELATILAVLRQNGDADAPTDPVRGLSRLGELLDALAAAGLKVEHRQLGSARPLPAAVDQAAYRIVQEALTNAHKHGAGATADLCVEYRPDAVVLDIVNPMTAGAPVREGGHGLTGMRERTVAVGGSFTAGPSDSGLFHVCAVLPAAQPEGMR